MNIKTVLGLYQAGMLPRKRALEVLTGQGVSMSAAKAVLTKLDAGETAEIGKRPNRTCRGKMVARRTGRGS